MYDPYGSAQELVQQLNTGALSAVEVMQATLDRIDALNPALNAVVALRPRAASSPALVRGPL